MNGLYDVGVCVSCEGIFPTESGIDHWCDNYIMCFSCFSEIRQKNNFVVVKHPEFLTTIWGWVSETQEIISDGGAILR